MLQARMALKDAQRPTSSRTTAARSRGTKRRSRPTRPRPRRTSSWVTATTTCTGRHAGAKPANDALIDKAVENYKKAAELEQRPELKKLALQYLANAYGSDKLNDPAQSEPVVQQLIEMDPNEPVNYFALARDLRRQRRLRERRGDAREGARDARPTDPAVYTTLAAFYNRQGEFDKSIEALQARAEREPNNPEAFYTIATYYWEKAYRDFSLSDAEKMKHVQPGIDGDRQGDLRSTTSTWKRWSTRTCCSACRRTSNGILHASRRCSGRRRAAATAPKKSARRTRRSPRPPPAGTSGRNE